MKTVFDNIKGDRIIWAIAALLAIFSFLPVYSAASNLAYTGNGSNTFSYFIKHFVHLFLGFSIIYGVHKIPYRYFRGLSLVMIPVVLILLIEVYDVSLLYKDIEAGVPGFVTAVILSLLII